MGLFRKITNAIASKIDDTVHYEVFEWEDTSEAAQNAIVHRDPRRDFANNSLVVVAPSQVAVYYNEGEFTVYENGSYALESGNTADYNAQTLKTSATGGASKHHNALYFINLVSMKNLAFSSGERFPVNDVDIDEPVDVGAYGRFGAHIDNDDKTGEKIYNFMTKVMSMNKDDFTRDDLEEFLIGKIQEYVKSLLGTIMGDKQISVLRVTSHYRELSEAIFEDMKPKFAEYGIVLDEFSFNGINVPPETLKAYRDQRRKQRATVMEAEANAKKTEIESIAMAGKRAREGYTYQQERGFDVLGTAAANEATPGQLMGAGMGLGMGVGVGGAFGAAMNNMAQNTFNSMNQQPNGYYPPNGYPQQPNGYYPPNGYPQQPNGYSQQPNGYSQQPNGYPQQPNGQYAPVVQPAQAAPAKCAKCGADLMAGAKFCLNCGAPVEIKAAPTKCAKCGADLMPGAKFCLNCGTPVAAQPAEPCKCSKCGADLMPGAKFCLNCGTPVAAQPAEPCKCSKCGAELTPGAKFCLNCGTPVEQQ